MEGISNRGRNLHQPYVTAGDRAYLIGTQDGDFPDMGQHVPGEMGGLWLHPIKLVDGFWARLRDKATGREVALSRADELVTYPYGTRLRYGLVDGLEIERFQFSPQGQPGVVVQYRFRNPTGRARHLDFDFAVRTDLSPVWFSERIGIGDARDSVAWHAKDRRFMARDTEHTWFAVWAVDRPGDARPAAASHVPATKGMGVTAVSRHRLSVPPGNASTLTFIFAGSATSEAEALKTYSYLAANHPALLEEKKEHYARLLDQARVSIPDRRLQEVYDWVRINMAWLVRDVPGIGRGLGGGLMEYPWWFGTETYSLQALLATGDFDLAKETLRLLESQSDKTNGNGRIIHELTTAGAVSNPGNSQETAQFILTVGQLTAWTGDLAFAREMYPAMRRGLEWLLGTMDRDRNLFPEGYGIMEVSGLNAELIDVAVYTQQALVATAHVAEVLGERERAAQYRGLASQLKARIDRRFWVDEEGSYADFYGSKAQAVSAATGAMKQIGLKGENELTRRDREMMAHYAELAETFAAMPDTSRGWLTNENWVITTPMEMGIAPRARAIGLLDRIRRESVGEYGPYLSAVERDRMMTIATGVQAVSEARYGRTEQALWYMDRIVETFNRVTPGSISEMMPDGGCFTIAWTSYGIVIPLIHHVFGVRPDAVNQTVVFDPHVPADWDEVSLEELPVGSNRVSLHRARTDRGIEYTIESRDSTWTLVLKPEDSPARYYLNGEPVPSAVIRMTGRRNHVLVVR
ncbi:MAG: trehalase family glycosidase [Gemmatimonadales bacterium]